MVPIFVFALTAIPQLPAAGPQASVAPPDTRAAQIAAQQEEKSRVLKPPEPDKAEKYLRQWEALFLESPSGWFPYFGSVYQGGGLTLGAGYRRFFGDNSAWNIKGLYSTKHYKLIDGAVESKGHLGDRLSLAVNLGWRDATQVPYFGLGTNSDAEGRTNFRFQQTFAAVNSSLRIVPWLPIQASVAAEDWRSLRGQGEFPSIERVHTPASAPGLGSSPFYLHSKVSAGMDWRKSPGYTRKGGLYQATFHDYRNNNGGVFSFQRLDGEIIQHIPLYRETWVLAGRARAETTLDGNDLIPYFLLPALGNGTTLRAYQTDRFRDRHSLLMQAEFRWLPNQAVDMALFYDAGKVTRRRKDLDFKGLKSDVGIGIRFHGLIATPLRIDLAYGNEGLQLVLSGGAVF